MFDFLVFPWLIVTEDNSVIYRTGGSLFTEYSNLAEASRSDAVHCPRGWSICRNGFAIFKRSIHMGNSDLAFYHLKINGVSTRQGRNPEGHLSINLTRDQFEQYVANFLSTTNRMGVFIHRLSHQTIHDIRHLNGEIQTKCDSLIRSYENGVFDQANIDRYARNIKALSEIMSASTDFLEVIANPKIGNIARSMIGVYRKFDKARLALQESRRYGERRFIQISGTSERRISALSVFDVIPFIALQNAMKYSPSEAYIEVDIRDTTVGVDVIVRHLGTVVEDDELPKIFSPGFRTKSAILHTQGNGFGLFFLKRLIELHEGCSVRFVQSGDIKYISGNNYRNTYLYMTFA